MEHPQSRKRTLGVSNANDNSSNSGRSGGGGNSAGSSSGGASGGSGGRKSYQHQVRRPASVDCLGHLLVAVATPQTSFRLSTTVAGRHSFSELEFEFCQITQNWQEKIRVAEICHVAGIVTARHSHEPRPGGENKDRVCSTFRGDSFQLFQEVFRRFFRCNHEGPLDMKSVVFLSTAADRV